MQATDSKYTMSFYHLIILCLNEVRTSCVSAILVNSD
jgi:hypothetical protein